MIDGRRYAYFAYGSNMLRERIQALGRAPTAQMIGVGTLRGYRLAFDKFGRDGSGKGNIVPCQDKEVCVFGVLFDVGDGDKEGLDKFEGAGRDYAVKDVVIETDAGRSVKAFSYIALKTQPDLKPFDWYKYIVAAGALQHDLPKPYIRQILDVPHDVDADAERRAPYDLMLAPYLERLEAQSVCR